MCDKDYERNAKQATERAYNRPANDVGQELRTESHMVYELKQKREYLFSQLSIVQKAIEAVNLANNF